MFSLPLLGATAALPRAYCVPDQPVYSPHFMLLKPDRTILTERMLPLFRENKKDVFDMDTMNTVLGPSSLVIPHRPWTMLSGEFFRTDEEHRLYLGLSKTDQVEWDAERELAKAKTVHFSDWPIPKPWVLTDPRWTEQEAPKCKDSRYQTNSTVMIGTDCRDRNAWLGLRQEFAKRRRVSRFPCLRLVL